MKLPLPRSLFGQIISVQFLTIAFAALVLPLIAYGLLHRTVIQHQEELLTEEARILVEGLARDPSGRWRVDLDPGRTAVYRSALEGRAYLILGRDGHALVQSAGGTEVPPGNVPRGRRPIYFRSGHFVGQSVPISTAQGRMWAVVLHDQRDPSAVLDDIVRSFFLRFLVALVLILLAIPLFNALLIRRSVRRIRRASAAAETIGPGTLHERLSPGDLPSEVAPLAVAVNLLLDRVEAAFQVQGEFVANVAHELRTPLAALRLRLDGMPEGAERAAIARVIDRMSHVVSQLLDLASLERPGPEVDGSFDLEAAVRDTVEELAPAVHAGGRELELIAPDAPVIVAGSERLVSLALSNLVDNAMRHTPPGTRIRVSVATDGILGVEDDGPGIRATDIGSIARRFRRGDSARSDSAGIGLSIVERIATAIGATLDVGNRPEGGARFAIRLRRPEQAG